LGEMTGAIIANDFIASGQATVAQVITAIATTIIATIAKIKSIADCMRATILGEGLPLLRL